jgi:hypothetical protein
MTRTRSVPSAERFRVLDLTVIKLERPRVGDDSRAFGVSDLLSRALFTC